MREVSGSNPGAPTISSSKMTHHRKILSFTVLALLFVPAAWLIYHETRVPQNEADVFNVVSTEEPNEKNLRTCEALGFKS